MMVVHMVKLNPHKDSPWELVLCVVWSHCWLEGVPNDSKESMKIFVESDTKRVESGAKHVENDMISTYNA